jgi:hypothetical protein
VKEFFKKNNLVFSNELFLNEVFYPKLTLSTNFKFNPKYITLDLNKNKNLIVLTYNIKKFFLYFFNSLVKINKIYFFKIHNNKYKLNYRKRKNINLNFNYSINLNGYKFFDFLKFISISKNLLKCLKIVYNLKKPKVFFVENKNSYNIYFINLHWLLSFLYNTKFNKNNFFFVLNIDFSKTKPFFKNYFKIFLNKEFNLNEKE